MHAKTKTVIVKNDAARKKAVEELVAAIRVGGVFVYPTDTIYGLGCDARNASAVKRLRALKKRDARKPFSVIVPSKEWIRENCFLNAEAASALDRLLPGPYTIVLKLINASCVSPCTNARALTLGVRIPNHWSAAIAEKTGAPIVTTSVNESGAPPARSLAEIKKFCGNNVDLIVFEGALHGKASRVIDYSRSRAVITR